jgi:hypothetical protein
VFIAQTIRHPLDQLDLVVEALGHPVGVALPNVSGNRFEPTMQCSRYALQWLLNALTRSLYQLQQGLSGGFLICAIAPQPHVLHPVDRFASLRKAPAPLATRDQRVHVQLIG